jgi:ankyrin repeat protein
VDVLMALLDAKADVNALNAKHSSPIMLAADYGSAEAARILLENNANPDVEDADGDLPLGVAIRRRTSSVSLLVSVVL